MTSQEGWISGRGAAILTALCNGCKTISTVFEGRGCATIRSVADIRAGQIVAFYLFDVAETIDLARVPALVGSATTQARLAPKPATPAYVQYDKPPLSFDGAAIGIAELEGFQVRLRTYDYGVVSVALSRDFCGDWDALLRVGQTLIENDEFEQRAEGVCRRLIDRLQPALIGAHGTLLSEDYLVY